MNWEHRAGARGPSSTRVIAREQMSPIRTETIRRPQGRLERGDTRMAEIDRRKFLAQGSMVVAAAGAAAAVPALTGGLGSGGTGSHDVGAVPEGDAGALTEPLVVHVRDLATGEIGVFSGTREVVVRDRQLASRLYNASR